MGELLRTMNERGQDIATSRRLRGPAGRPHRADRQGDDQQSDWQRRLCADTTGRAADEIVATEGLAQIGDKSALLDIIRGVIAANADAVAQYRAGKMQTFGFLVGQVMKGSKGKANPKLANELLKKELDN